MPLFFCISGYLFKNNKTFKEFFEIKCKKLLIPYVIYFIVSYLVCITILKHDIRISEMLKYLLFNGEYCSLVENWPLWYLPLFFIASIVFYFISKIKNNKIFIATIFLSGLITVPVNNVLQGFVSKSFIPFSIQVLPAAIFYIGIGNIVCKYRNISFKKNKFVEAIISIVLCIVGIIISIKNNDQIIDITTYKYLIAALLIIQFVIYITKDNRNKAIIYLGKNSLIILGLHMVIFKVMYTYKLAIILMKYNITGDVAAILVTGLCIVIICLINEIIKYVKNLVLKSRII